MGKVYDKLMEFKNKYLGGVTWFRLKQHCNIVEKHLNPNEDLVFVFAGQLDKDHFSFFNTGVVAITTERLIVAQNRLIVGYKFSSITPDLYNDLQVEAGLIWGLVTVDTVREQIYVSDLPKSGLSEIETQVTMAMQEAKKKYKKSGEEDK